jgi:hypothetical protein
MVGKPILPYGWEPCKKLSDMINTLCTFLFILLSFKYNFWEPAKAKKTTSHKLQIDTFMEHSYSSHGEYHFPYLILIPNEPV